MLKKIIFVTSLLAHSFTAHAVRVQLFSEYSLPRDSFHFEKRDNTEKLSLSSILPKGLAISAHPRKRFMIEGSLHSPYVSEWIPHHGQTAESRTIIGVVDLHTKIIIPLSKRFARTKCYVRTGPWYLRYAIQTRDSKKHEEKKGSKKNTPSMYGWTLGAGIMHSLPFWPKLPFDISLAYYYPVSGNNLPKRVAPTGFASLKIGLMWPK